MFISSKKFASLTAALICFIAAPARAGGLYVYVDEQGIPHYSLQQLDARYQLFSNDGPALSDDVVFAAETHNEMNAKLPDMAKIAGKLGKTNRRNLPLDVTEARMKNPAGMRIPAPSQATLTRLLKNASLARYEPIIVRHARKSGVDVNLVKAVMAAESGFNPSAISPKSAMGLMQVIGPTAARYGVTEAQLMTPERNIYAGVRYLADLSRMFKGRPELIIAAYNAGEGAVYKYNRQIPPYKETQNYVRTVLQFYNVYAPKIGSSNVIVSDDAGSIMPYQKNTRRSMQRVKMKVSSGFVKNKITQFE